MEPKKKATNLKSLRNYVPSAISLSKSENKLIKSIPIKKRIKKKD